jgi:hypothetical protein
VNILFQIGDFVMGRVQHGSERRSCSGALTIRSWPGQKIAVCWLAMKDKTITAVVSLSGFVITLAIAWHGGAFADATDADQTARAPVRLTDPMTTLPFAGQVRLASADGTSEEGTSAEGSSGGDTNAGAQAEGDDAPQPAQQAQPPDVQSGPPPQYLAQPQDSQFAAQQQLPPSDQPPTSPEDAPPLYGSYGNEAPANDASVDPVSPEERETRLGNRHH